MSTDRIRRVRGIDRTPQDRALAASIAAHSMWAQTGDRTARTEPARSKFEARFERQVDPDGVLDPAERIRRAKSARTAYFRSLALKSAKSRRANRAKSKGEAG